LKKETADVTSIIVAQRVGTIMDADKIVVLDNGKVAGIGKHHDLLDTCPVYKEIVQSQLSEEDMRR
jgi:ATP-binding cassette subfamily B protein